LSGRLRPPFFHPSRSSRRCAKLGRGGEDGAPSPEYLSAGGDGGGFRAALLLDRRSLMTLSPPPMENNTMTLFIIVVLLLLIGIGIFVRGAVFK
jgi:hypothetical protein